MPFQAMRPRNRLRESGHEESEMDSERAQVLRDVIQISQAMLAMARDNEWERVSLLEAERRLMVQNCFNRPTREQDAPEVAVAIREILRLNQEVAELGRTCKDRLGADIRVQKVGRSASAAYRSHAG